MRTASLLEADIAVAQDAVVSSLASASRRWRALDRDGNAEAEVRRSLHETVIGLWRRADALDDVPPPDRLPVDASGARTALATLTNRQRALVVLAGLESLVSREIAAILQGSVDEVQADIASAAASLRQSAAAPPDAPLLPLLNAAALRDVPTDLASRALARASAGRRQTAKRVVVAMVLLVAVTGGALVVLSEGETAPGTDPVAASIEQWGIPSDAPPPRDLPSLAEEPIQTASMAYVTGGVPIVTDAVTGAARTVLAGEPQPQWYDGYIDGTTTGLLRRGPPWTQAVLSPDGRWLLLVQAPVDERDDATGVMYLVRIDTAVVTPVPEVLPIARPLGEVSIANTVLAWAPGGGAFACVCDGKLSVFDLQPTAARVVEISAYSTRVTDVAWGVDGLVARKPNGEWMSVSAPSTPLQQVGSPAALAMSVTTPTAYLSVSVTAVYALGADTEPDGGRCVWWNEDFSTPVPVTPVPDRDGPLCTPVALQPGRSGILLVLRPDRPRPQPLPLDLVAVDREGASVVVGTLPPGTTFASFAARLVG